jgi:hypothetical protein
MLIKDIEDWITSLDTPKNELDQNKVCPFAKSASYKIIECPLLDVRPLPEEFDLFVFKVENTVTQQELITVCKDLNQKYKDVVFLPDHKDRSTFLNGVQTNNGKHNLILCQSRKKLEKARLGLAKTNYYSFWDNAYLEEILGT